MESWSTILNVLFHEIFWFLVFSMIVDHIFLDGKITNAIISRIQKDPVDGEEFQKNLEEIEELKKSLDVCHKRIHSLEEDSKQKDKKIELYKSELDKLNKDTKNNIDIQ